MSVRRSRRGAWALLGTALALGVMTSSAAPAERPSPWKNPPERFVLATGLPCVYQKDASSPTTVVGFIIGGGKSAVPPGLDGLAAVSTRLLLEIPDESKVQALMAQATRLSFVCLEDCSIILIECLTRNLEDALRLAGKIIQDPLLSGLRVSRVKELMKTTAKAAQDDPVGAARAEVFSAFFGGAGYGSDVYGTEAGLKAFDRKDVLAFVRRFVVKPNVFFCVISDLDPDPVRRLLEKSFASFPDGAVPQVVRREPVVPDERDVRLERDTRQTCVGLAVALPLAGLRDMALGDLLENLLGKGPGSRLWTLREEERLAYDVDADLTWTKSSGILFAHLETGRDKAQEAGLALDRTIAALAENGLTEEELAATRTMARARFLRATEEKSPRLRIFGLFETLGFGAAAGPGFLEAMDAVTLEELNAFVRQTLDPARALRVTVGRPAGEPGKEEADARSDRN